MFHINHYIPSLGSSSAGCSCFTDSITDALSEIEHSLSHMSKDDKIVIKRVDETEEGSDEGGYAR